MFKAEIMTSNAAFDDGYSIELPRILREIADSIERDGPAHHKAAVRDVNGNMVGYWVEDGEL